MTGHNAGDAVVSRVVANIISDMPLQGANSRTYLAMDPQFQAEVVLKEVSYGTPQDRQKALSEVQRLHAVQHPYVARTQYAADTGTNVIRVVMPYYRKGSLHERMNSGPLAINDALRYTSHVLIALAHVHSNGMIHADVKPSNVLIDDNDHAILTDFGQSVEVRPTDQLADKPPMYNLALPPETIGVVTISRQADVYQAGLMLYRLLNGHKLWSQQITTAKKRQYGLSQMKSGKWPDRQLWLPHIPDNLRSVVRKAMNPDPLKRYATVDEFANALSRVAIPARLGACKPTETSEGWEWKHPNNAQEYITVLRYNQKGEWEIAATRTNVQTQHTEKLRQFSHDRLKNQPAAFGKLNARFRQA